MDRLPTSYRWYFILLAGLLLGGGCQPAAPAFTPQPVALPNLEGLTEAAQQQIREQHTRTRGEAARANPEALGAAYGTLGQLLFTYDFLDAAETALRNAEGLRPDDMQWAYYLGMLYRQRGDFEAAAAQFERVVERQPDDALARLRWAETHLERGRPDDARRLLGQVVEADPRNPLAHFLLGQIAYEAEDYAAAVTHFETVLELQPTATQVHASLALAYRSLGDEAQSAYHLARRGSDIIRINDPRVQALEAFKQTTGATAVTQGEALINAGRYPEAIAALEQAIAQDASNASNYLNLGVARAYAGDQQGAVAAFEQTLQVDPGNSKAHYNIGALHAAGGRLAQAEERFRAAIDADARHGEAHLDLAELLRRSGRCAEAVAHFEAALSIIPGDIGARQHLSLCHLRLDRRADARAVLEAGLAANPNHLGFIDALARLLATTPDAAISDAARALSLAEQAIALRRRTETLETLAMAHARLGRYADAVTHQQEAIQMAEQVGHSAYLAHLRETLRRYQQDTPSRAPWPDFMYEL